MMKTSRIMFSVSCILFLLFSSCSNLFEIPDGQPEGSVSFARSVIDRFNYPDGSLFAETGKLGPGAYYTVVLPPLWQSQPEESRKLVLYAHGYVPRSVMIQPPVAGSAPQLDPVLSYFVSAGYAVAFSTYSENGWAVKDGAIRTRQLRDYIVDKMGHAQNIYLFGVSEGALIALKLAEQNPELFSGALAFAGPLGGAKLQFEYITNVRLVFDHFFKNKVMQTAVMGIPQAVSLSFSLGYTEDKSALEAVPDPYYPQYIDPMVFIADMAPFIYGLIPETPMPDEIEIAKATMELTSVQIDGADLFTYMPEEIIYSILTALWYNIYGSADVLDRTHGHIPIDNRELEYTYTAYDYYLQPLAGSPFPFDVERFDAAPDALKYLDHWYVPRGILQIPVVSLHIARDPAVPYIYGSIPYPNMLKIVVPGYGHTVLIDSLVPPVFNDYETMAALLGAFKVLDPAFPLP